MGGGGNVEFMITWFSKAPYSDSIQMWNTEKLFKCRIQKNQANLICMNI